MCNQSLRVIPNPGNQYSPLLATCYESREKFLAAHPLRLPVFDWIKSSDLRLDLLTGSEEGLDNLRSGAVYINPATDMFVLNADLDVSCTILPPSRASPKFSGLPQFFTRFLEPEIRIQVSRALTIIPVQRVFSSSHYPQPSPLWYKCIPEDKFPGVTSCFNFSTSILRGIDACPLGSTNEVQIWQKLTQGIMGETHDLDIERGDMGYSVSKCGSSRCPGSGKARQAQERRIGDLDGESGL